MSKQLTMKTGVVMFAALVLAGALAIFAFSAYQPVAAQETTSDNVTRSFSATDVETGGTLDVTITFDGGALDVVKVTEMLPDGWTYQSVVPADVEVAQSEQNISFDMIGGEDVTYTVMAPDMAGSAMFRGTVAEQDGAYVGGESMVTVSAPAPPEPEPTPLAPAPAPVQDLSLEAGINMLAATWSHSQGADDYTVQWRAMAATDWSEGATTTDNFYDITGLTGGTTYWVRVRPNMEGAEESRFTAVRGTPDSPAPKPEPGVKLEDGVTLSSMNADTAVRVVVGATAGSVIRGGNDIEITMSGFQFPDGGIDEDEVIVQGAGSSFYGNPQDISVSGSKITVTIPTKVIGAGGAAVDTQLDAGVYQVTFKQNAGLKTPTSSGTKTVTVDDGDATDEEFDVSIVTHVSVKPSWASRGDAVTVTGKGINASGTATVHLTDMKITDKTKGSDLTDELVLGTASMDGGAAVVEVDTSSSRFDAGAVAATKDDDAKGTNTIVMVDAGGNIVGSAVIGITPTVSLDVTEVRRSGLMEITVSDWYYGDVYDVKVNGIQVNLPDGRDEGSEADDWEVQSVGSDNKETFDVIVDRSVRLGTMQVVVYGETKDQQGTVTSQDKHSQTVDVGVFDLSVNPTTAVSDQVIRIEGSGFLSRACITSITVGERSIDEATNGDDVSEDSRDCVDTDSNGKLADSFRVPLGLKPGTYRLVVRDDGNRVGEADLEIAKPTIVLDPVMSQRGDTVTVVGSNFPAEDLITVSYVPEGATRGIPVASASSDTVGKWRATFTVPVTAPIGAEHEVVAQSQDKGDGSEVEGFNFNRADLNAKAIHEVPDETLEVSPDIVAAGQRLTVTGGNLPLFTPVSVIIGGIRAAGRVIGEDDASDGSGRYQRVILVPQLQPGTHTVELIAHARNEDISVARFVEISDIVTRPTDEVFAGQIAAGQLLVVWRYDNATSTWASYNPTAPAEINDLIEVSTDDIVWVEVTENVEFQGQTLFAGWNLISLE